MRIEALKLVLGVDNCVVCPRCRRFGYYSLGSEGTTPQIHLKKTRRRETDGDDEGTAQLVAAVEEGMCPACVDDRSSHPVSLAGAQVSRREVAARACACRV